MVIIIEGANFTGKDTLINSFGGRYPVYRALYSLPPTFIKRHELSNVISADMYAADMTRQLRSNFIWHRSPLSAVIYDGLPLESFLDWAKLLPVHSMMLILICQPKELLKRMSEHGAAEKLEERGLTENMVLDINEAYSNIEWEVHAPIPIYNIDVTDGIPQFAKDIIHKHFKENKNAFTTL